MLLHQKCEGKVLTRIVKRCFAALVQNRSTLKRLGLIEKLAVSSMSLKDFGINLLYYIDHFGIKVTNPVQFILIVALIAYLQYVAGGNDHGTIKTLGLMLRHDPKENSKCFAICFP